MANEMSWTLLVCISQI